ncbi:GGDEF domain-containing protein [Saccharothrix syringae]|uniref:GGDEF domain-containing protein n=1 Tax=Saccharothrix syringae TaxID=103733 RepID=A0A5Q0HD26_SACSY|nr:GGDEF domain-containing protein [Saccharothrix syringae]QFZ23884.1 GGDEF domain-containing protein [Saccharothrix syringae]
MGAVRTTESRAVWDEFVSGLPVGLALLDEHGSVLAANPPARPLLDDGHGDGHDDSGAPLPSRAELAAQALRTGAPLVVPVVLPRARVWAEYHPVNGRVLVLLRPVRSDAPHSSGFVDALTGLPNRALLLDRLDQALVRARTHGTLATLVLVDVRGMAAVNAAHGFERGDGLLAVLAGRLRRGLRADHTVARYGGGSFAVVAEHPGGTGEAVAARVRELAGRAVSLGGTPVRPGVRVCWVTGDGDVPVPEVVAEAERRLRR